MTKWAELNRHERNILIAEKIMGWRWWKFLDVKLGYEVRFFDTHSLGADPAQGTEPLDYRWNHRLPDYWQDTNAAMTVVDKWPYRVAIWKTAGPDLLPWCCAFYTNDSRYRVLGYGPTVAEAICQTAAMAMNLVEE
jgi:hypothetical protein